ncbi:MAG: hypothetical protein HYY16_14775 [Planctomycetes bacterium]|nr:hypothetical protein [Planctomycetota bacterium]
MKHPFVVPTLLLLLVTATAVARGTRQVGIVERPVRPIYTPAQPEQCGPDGLAHASPSGPADSRPPERISDEAVSTTTGLATTREPAAGQARRPLDEIDRAVNLTEDQRRHMAQLVEERETLMHAAYSEAVLTARDVERGVAQVGQIYTDFDAQILQTLNPDQQVRYTVARHEGRIGNPMFVFRYGGSSD